MDLMTTILACSLYTNNSITNAMVQLGSQNKELTITVVGQPSQSFPSAAKALSYANDQLKQNQAIEIGLMQIPNRWLVPMHTTTNEVLAPCKNIVTATAILNQAYDKCAELKNDDPNLDLQSCALSIYKTGDAQSGMDYANQVITYANDHSFEAIVAEAKKKNPKEFSMTLSAAHTQKNTKQ